MPNTIYGANKWSPYTQLAQLVAEASGAEFNMCWLNEAEKTAQIASGENMTGKFPMLKTDDGIIHESVAIARYFAYGHATLNGSNANERAVCDQWIQWQISTAGPAMMPALMAIFGFRQDTPQAEFTDSNKACKENLKNLNTMLGDNQFICGNTITVADYVVANGHIMAFQTMLDQGFCKAMPKAAAWFKRVSSLPAFVKVCGVITTTAKAMKPILKVEVKAPKVVAPVVKKEEKKIEGDQFVETDFALYDYKTFLVNLKDMGGEGIAETKKMFQKPGFNNSFSYWYFQYDKYGDEGEVHYKFANLMTGWMQRCDPKLSPLAFGRMLMLGKEPSLEFEGVFLIHNQKEGGNDFPVQFMDHPQLEYMKKRKLDFVNNEEDYNIVSQFFGVHKVDVQSEKTCMGKYIMEAEWFK